jgi:hypothetical protein
MFIGITQQDVKDYLENYIIKKLSETKFRTNKPIVAFKKLEMVAIDLIDLSSLLDHNRDYRYILTCVDIFSRFTWLFKLKNKDADTVKTAIMELFNVFTPHSVLSDNGGEFKNASLSSYYESSPYKARLVSVNSNKDINIYTSPFQNKGRLSWRCFVVVLTCRFVARSTQPQVHHIQEVVLSMTPLEPDTHGKRYKFSKQVDLVSKVMRVRNFTNLL